MGVLVPYFGGKNRSAKRIISSIPNHDCYVEVFAGGAGVFFKKEPSPVEVINDLDKELVTFYRVVKHHPEEFHRQFKFVLCARDEFNRYLQVNPETLTDIQRAVRYYYLQRLAFGGKVTGQTFGTAVIRSPRINLFNLENTITEAWRRLVGVTIECLDFRKLIPRYDRPETFFYLDPPYWQIPGYRHDFCNQDFIDLAAVLALIKGKFLMSINDTPEIRDIFKEFVVEEVVIRYSLSTKAREKERIELLISNYG